MTITPLLHTLSDPQIVRAAIDANVGHYIWLCCQNPVLHPPEDQHFGDDIHWAFSTHPFGLFNSVWLSHVEGEALDAHLKAIMARTEGRQLSMRWINGMTSDQPALAEYLREHDFFEIFTAPNMAAVLDDIDLTPASIPGLRIERVTSAEQLDTFISVFAPSFDLPPDWGIEGVLHRQWAPFYLNEHDAVFYIGWLDGEAVTCSTLIYGAGVAGVYNVSTLPSARGKGLGRALTIVPLREAIARGYKVGVLAASEMGYNIYERLGFRSYGKYEVFLWANMPSPFDDE